MKNLLKSVVFILLVGLQFSFLAPANDKLDCTMLHSGTFTYTDDEGDEVIVVIEGESYIEYFKDRKYSLERKLQWVNDCEFNALFIKSNLPNLGRVKKATMNLKVNRIVDNYVYFTVSLKAVDKGSFKKVMEGDYTK